MYGKQRSYIITDFQKKSRKHEPRYYKGSGILYLTSGNHIVLDHGWGEYFSESDTPICTLEDLRHGFFKPALLTAIKKAEDKRRAWRRSKDIPMSNNASGKQ